MGERQMSFKDSDAYVCMSDKFFLITQMGSLLLFDVCLRRLFTGTFTGNFAS
jgi:hypothetical protein